MYKACCILVEWGGGWVIERKRIGCEVLKKYSFGPHILNHLQAALINTLSVILMGLCVRCFFSVCSRICLLVPTFLRNTVAFLFCYIN